MAGEAIPRLTADALGGLAFEAMAPVKALLKRYFSASPWSTVEAESLADAVGPGEGWWRHELGATVLEHGWRDGRYRIEVGGAAGVTADEGTGWLAEAFEGEIVPEATPSNRTIRFATGAGASGGSRWYERGHEVDDERAARLLALDGVENVLVGPGFVAVGVDRPGRWESRLRPVLAQIREGFAGGDGAAPPAAVPTGFTTGAAAGEGALPAAGRLARAYDELAGADGNALLAAAASEDLAVRQAAASRLAQVDPATAERGWRLLLIDPSRSVRRTTVDAVVDAGREELRVLLERALADVDGWTRWKSLRGLADLGLGSSRDRVAALADDPDFRVRLEATAALRSTP